ncbi:MarR family transcriptional regulator [Geodermatophilus sp. URMC 62]|uniref:MarR family transcriptional regulator n=1 Tax=Geodermatophilus sp. URMC 62 TaxID=3423414 RepID=UPI00406D1BD2
MADALVSTGRALTLLGTRLAAVHDEDAAAVEVVTLRAELPRGGPGPRQLAVLALGGFDTPAGLSVADVETATSLQRPNVHKLLQRLTELGHLEQLPDERPARWHRVQPSAG